MGEHGAFEVPLSDISQATAAKGDAVIEMADDDTAMPDDEMVVELRMHMVGNPDEDEAELTPAEQFVATIKESAFVGDAGNEAALAAFDDVQVQVPRGRYEIELFDKYIKLHGKTYDYKVLYTNVMGLYLLPKPDGYHMALAISLEHPLRQGATMYPHVVLQLPREASLEASA